MLDKFDNYPYNNSNGYRYCKKHRGKHMRQGMKRSRQRDAILSYLMSTTEHPTADMVYEQIRREIPNISLGTVYRNLNQLSEYGMIQKLILDGKTERFDGNVKEHYHVVCEKCGRVMDLDMQPLSHIDVLAGSAYGGMITGHLVAFTGICKDCLENNDKEVNNIN